VIRPAAPPGPFQPGFWRSPLRGPGLTSILGTLLLAGMGIVAVTGYLSHVAYEPDLGRNAIVDPGRDLPLNFGWPTHPSWLYAATQGLHVNVGLVVIPVLLAKLWSVMPRLFAWPPVASPAHAIERLGVAMLVSSAVFELATGVANMQNWYVFKFDFVVMHYYGGVVFVAALAVHVAIKMPVVVRAYRDRGVPGPRDPDGLVAVEPAEPTLSRRGLLTFVGAGSALLLVTNAGQSIGGPLRSLALLAPRRAVPGDGPNGFPVNKRFALTGIDRAAVGPAWRLDVGGPDPLSLTRDELLALEQHEATLPIACVEGWSTTERWAGVRLSELAAMAGVPDPASLLVESIQPRGRLRQVTLRGDQATDERALLALRVNDADLSLDHGYPARIIVPAVPGVHNTKWVARLTFEA